MTPYSDIYDVFLSQINDPIFDGLFEDTQDELMLRYLKNSIPRFKRCKQNLSERDDIIGQFNMALSDEEILILGTQMVVEYLNPKVSSLDLIKRSMSNRDFQMTSQAAHLKQIMDLRKMKQEDVQQLIRDYTYNNSDLSGLK
jgi:K+-transporting ATPase c subunit